MGGAVRSPAPIRAQQSHQGGDMHIERLNIVAFAVVGVMSVTAVPGARGQQTAASQTQADSGEREDVGPMVNAVREATAALQDPQAAVAAGYALASGCVSGPEE